MKNILNAAKVNPDKFREGILPTKPGDVSIMTIKQLYIALGGSISSHDVKYDPTRGYNTSAYCVYGIAGFYGNNSTEYNLEEVGLDWYKQKHKATSYDLTFSVNGQTLFGGPLNHIEHEKDNTYSFTWYCCEDNNGYPSSNGYYWDTWVPGFVEVAVVCMNKETTNK